MIMTTKEAAKIVHEINKAYCESLGDFSQKSWIDAPENIQQSAIDGVLFHIEHPNAKPSATHDNWHELKVKDGWVHGDVKDANQKTHPCLVPFDELPAEQRVKDHIFRGAVLSLLPFLTS